MVAVQDLAFSMGRSPGGRRGSGLARIEPKKKKKGLKGKMKRSRRA